MNKKISAAVASAALVLGASSANAGIIIPAGEWTLDVNGNVNVYATFHDADDSNTITGGTTPGQDSTGEGKSQSINTGLLPAWLGFTGTTRQNDLDVSFTISMQPGVSGNDVAGDAGVTLWRQAFLTFGDKSWGTVKMGKDLGVFAGNAILNDMTLLGVGGAASAKSGAATSLGGIGTGYIYPSWKGQITYTTPNMNGFTATAGIFNPNQHGDTSVSTNYQDRFGFEGQVQYEFSNGKVWASGASYEYQNGTDAAAVAWDATAVDIGAAVNFGNIGLVAYFYDTKGVGATMFGGYNGTTTAGGAVAGVGTSGEERDGQGGYIQATYVIPTGTKLGVAYGVSELDTVTGDVATSVLDENNRWTVGAYHPLTKHLNLVAEYNAIESKDHAGTQNESDSFSLGAILFF
jgi:predicted porin